MNTSTSEVSVSEDIKLFNEKYNGVFPRFPKETFVSYEVFKL